jgi:tetratricopeptide (TPR) repeat protein
LVAGRWDEATQHYNQALKANSEERDALLGLAYIAQQKGQRDDAQVLYRRVLRQEPNNAMASAALLALDAQADSTQSSTRAKELAMRQPDSAAAMSVAGTAAVREGLLADAAQLFARAQYLDPANPMHAYNHAVALDRLGQHAAAAQQYEQVLKLSEKPTVGRNAFSVDAVRERLAQLRQALAASPSKPSK